MVATLVKSETKEQSKKDVEVRFRCKHRDDKVKPGRSMGRFSEGHRCKDGSTFTIHFAPVPHEIHKVIPAYSEYIFKKSATLPENLSDEKWAGKLIYDYLKQHPDFLSSTFFEDKSYGVKLDFGEIDPNDLKVAKEANVKRILMEDEIRLKEEQLEVLEGKAKKGSKLVSKEGEK